MKANRHYTNCNDGLPIMGMSIKAKSCTRVSIDFTIDARHILLALVELGKDKYNTATRAEVEREIRSQLRYMGEDWYAYPINYGSCGNRFTSDLDEELRKVLPKAQTLFPEFFDMNSLDFIKNP